MEGIVYIVAHRNYILMKITNSTRKNTVSNKTEIANSIFKRSLGLMFRKEPRPLLMILDEESKPGIWMLFMRFPIDLVFIDSLKRVVSVVEDIKPINLNPDTWKIYYPSKPIKYVLELPAGTIKRKGIKTGDRLTF